MLSSGVRVLSIKKSGMVESSSSYECLVIFGRLLRSGGQVSGNSVSGLNAVALPFSGFHYFLETAGCEGSEGHLGVVLPFF